MAHHPPSNETQPHEIQAEAAEWVVRLGAETVSEVERAEFDRWRTQSAAHRAAFDYAERTWHRMARVNPAEMLPPVLPMDLARQRTGRHGARWVAWAACLFALTVLGLLQAGPLRLLMTADYRTAPGERREVSLPDASLVTLNTGSAIAVRFTAQERRVELLAGEAFFSVAPVQDHDTRPFVVSAGSGRTRALGTQFIVQRMDSVEEVTVVEHAVEVSATRNAADRSSLIVEAGHRVRYDSTDGVGHLADVNIDHATSWKRGRLMFDRVPLKEVITEINRYRRGGIMILNPRLAARQVSGVVLIDKLDDSLALIASELHAHTTSVSPFLTLFY